MDVRRATPDDWPAVAALLAELGRPNVLGTSEEEPARLLFLDYLKRRDAVALVAVDGGRVIGFCDVEFRPRLNFTTTQAWIPDLIVAEGERSRGAGAALLNRAVELAAGRECWSITLESANWRTRAHAFYEREGWQDTAHAFAKMLDRSLTWPPQPKS
jgi:GNAT superfamily N-acetyltransferase